MAMLFTIILHLTIAYFLVYWDQKERLEEELMAILHPGRLQPAREERRYIL